MFYNLMNLTSCYYW